MSLLLASLAAQAQTGQEVLLVARPSITVGADGDFMRGLNELGVDIKVHKENADGSLKDVKGSPFLFEDYSLGSLTIKGKAPVQALLRYNVLNESMEIKTEGGSDKVFFLQQNREVDYVINQNTIIYEELIVGARQINGYYIKHFEGKNLRLLEKPLIKAHAAVEQKTGYDRAKPARLEHLSEYFVVWTNGKIEQVEIKNKSLRKAFESEAVTEYLAENKVKTEEDLVSFAAFLDSLTN